LHFTLTGDIPAHAVERAIQLSRDKYCSVWQSLRQDTRLDTTFEVNP
jgi:putative redox protein